MSLSFALLLDDNNDFERILNESERHFGLKHHRISSSNANAIHKEKHFLLSASPEKLLFMVLDDSADDDFECLMKSIEGFVEQNFRDQTVGLKYYGSIRKHGKYFEGIKDVKVIEI